MNFSLMSLFDPSENIFWSWWFSIGGNDRELFEFRKLRLLHLIHVLGSEDVFGQCGPTVTSGVVAAESWQEEFVRNLGRLAGKTVKTTKSGLRSIGDVLHEITELNESIQKAVQDAAQNGGNSIDEAGQYIKRAAENMQSVIQERARNTRDVINESARSKKNSGQANAALIAFIVRHAIAKTVEDASTLFSGALKGAGMALSATGKTTADHAENIGNAGAGIVKGFGQLIGGMSDAVAISQDDVESAFNQLKTDSENVAIARKDYERKMEVAFPDRRDRFVEQVTIGGFSFAEAISKAFVPSEIEHAYQAAYPVESQLMDFREKVNDFYGTDQLEGLVNGVKGKLFELRYLEELNGGGLPEGWHAELASSATQPGWDFQIFDAGGNVQDLLSAKATDHMDYVREALHRYPDIDVVTTSEVYASLMGTPDGALLTDGGISNIDLHNAAQNAADGTSFELGGALLSVLALGPAAYRHFVSSDKPIVAKWSAFTAQVTRAKTAFWLGQSVLLAVPYWPVALMVSMGCSAVGSIGNNRREQLMRITAFNMQVRESKDRLEAKAHAITARNDSALAQ